jgi:hypothetical protein
VAPTYAIETEVEDGAVIEAAAAAMVDEKHGGDANTGPISSPARC